MKYLITLLFALGLACAGFAHAKEARSPSKIKNNPIVLEGGKSKLMSVVFSHKAHYGKGFSCITCHHESSTDTPYSSCRDCHSEPGANERDPMSMFMAFHAKGTNRSCYGCHTMLVEKNPGGYPLFKGCRPCHTPGSADKAAAVAAKQGAR